MPSSPELESSSAPSVASLHDTTATTEQPPEGNSPSEETNGGLSLLFAASLLQRGKDEKEPRQMDVLSGRGGGVNRHMGNRMYRRVVEYNKTIYRSVPKRHRMMVSQSIVQAILNGGGRFLQQKNGGWTEIPYRKAVQKTSQALRERPEEQATSSTMTVDDRASSPVSSQDGTSTAGERS